MLTLSTQWCQRSRQFKHDGAAIKITFKMQLHLASSLQTWMSYVRSKNACISPSLCGPGTCCQLRCTYSHTNHGPPKCLLKIPYTQQHNTCISPLGDSHRKCSTKYTTQQSSGSRQNPQDPGVSGGNSLVTAPGIPTTNWKSSWIQMINIRQWRILVAIAVHMNGKCWVFPFLACLH